MKKRKNVNYSDKTMVILIPSEERKGEALERYRIKRRIENVSNSISPILEKNLRIIRNHNGLTDKACIKFQH